MNTLGIVTEYNPFHNGHRYHLEKSKEKAEADFVVAVMSGNFMQRGEPAVLDKWTRARIAVDCGVDIVFELPFVFACNNAEYFAKGAIGILNGIGCVTHLSFGSELGDLSGLSRVAGCLAHETTDFRMRLKEGLLRGISFPRARYEAVKFLVGQDAADALKEPNNILAVEYLKQLQLSNSKIKPVTIKRFGAGYKSEDFVSCSASALAIRKQLMEGLKNIDLAQYLPVESAKVLLNINLDINKKINNYFLLVMSRILSKDEESLESLFSAAEGLGNKLKKEVRNAVSLEQLIEKVKSKRYTRTRIERLLTHCLMELDKSSVNHILKEHTLYARVLGFSDEGAKLLKAIKLTECAKIPILTNINKEVSLNSPIRSLLRFDILAGDMYNLISGKSLYEYSDFTVRPYYKLI